MFSRCALACRRTCMTNNTCGWGCVCMREWKRNWLYVCFQTRRKHLCENCFAYSLASWRNFLFSSHARSVSVNVSKIFFPFFLSFRTSFSFYFLFFFDLKLCNIYLYVDVLFHYYFFLFLDLIEKYEVKRGVSCCVFVLLFDYDQVRNFMLAIYMHDALHSGYFVYVSPSTLNNKVSPNGMNGETK